MTTKNTGMRILLVLLFIGVLQTMAFAQTAAAPSPGITIYQYRRVPANKREEFIRRETTYWAEIAKRAIAKGNLTFWGLLEKVSGDDMENSSNFLFMNSCQDVDKLADVYSQAAISAAFPNLTMDKISTDAMSTVTGMFFLRDEDWQQAATAVPDKDFKFITMVYHNATQPANLIALERKHWGPFIKGAMDKKQTTQTGWGNAVLLSPTGDKVGFTTVSYDLYSSLKEALYPTWDPKVVFPEDGLAEIGKLETGRSSAVYQIIKGVDAN